MASVKEKGQAFTPQMQEMMRVYREYGTPGASHILLSRMAGTWNTSVKTWMDGKPSMETTGTSRMKMLFDGRFLQQEETMDMMGKQYQGLGIIGYDNFEKKHTMFWLDNMNTRMQYFEGTASSDGKTITVQSNFLDPVKGQWKNRAVTTLKDNNTFKFEMFSSDKSGKEEKMMEIIYTRQK